MKLPFLDTQSRWPTAKDPEERVVNPSYDKQIQDHLMDEFLLAMEHKDSSSIKESLLALIQSIKEEEG